MFRPFRVFFEADASNGSTPPAPVVSDAPPASDNPPPPPPATPAKDPNAEMRYHISRERERANQVQKEFDEYKAKTSQPPQKFDATNDPDGTKELDYRAAQKAEEIVQKILKESGIDQKVNELHYKNEQDNFFGVVEKSFDKFKSLGIEPPSRQEMIDVMSTLNEKGVTPEQLIALARFEQITGKLKPTGFSPSDWGKPAISNNAAPKSNEEVFASIYQKHGVFGYGS